MKVLYILAFTNKGLRQMVWKQIPVFMRSITLAIDQTHCELPWRRAICRQKNICTELDIKNKKMRYYIDLQDISIDQYKGILKTADMIPSWRSLKKNVDENLDLIKAQHVRNLGELQKALKNKSKIQAFSQQSSLQEDYLVLLRRMVNGYHPKPNRIKDFPNVSEEVAGKLEEMGIKHTLSLYEEILTPEKRKELSDKTGISKVEIVKLARLTDLSRIRWVNHTFAYVLMEAGYDTTEAVAKADYQALYETVKQLNKEREIYKANIGPNDMKLCIESARGLDFEIVY